MNSSQAHERHCRGYIDCAELTSALADMRDSVPWAGNRADNVRNAVRRLIGGSLWLVVEVTPSFHSSPRVGWAGGCWSSHYHGTHGRTGRS